MSLLLDVDNLTVEFQTQRGPLRAVDGVSFQLSAGETLGIVGESGSGKSVTSLALMGLLPANASVTASALSFEGIPLLGLSPKGMRKVRGGSIAMIFQDPMTSLNPCFTVGFQIDEALKAHDQGPKAERRRRALELLDRVGIADAPHRLNAYPHELSGGMSQRVMIAIALACRPRLLIADEPTTALDVTIQAQILDLLGDLCRESNMGLILITHDLGVVAEHAKKLCVMYAGEIVESGLTRQVLQRPRHPYTEGLLQCLPGRAGHGKSTRLPSIAGLVPDLTRRPSGCQFNPRCSKAVRHCVESAPTFGGGVRCHFPVGEAL